MNFHLTDAKKIKHEFHRIKAKTQMPYEYIVNVH